MNVFLIELQYQGDDRVVDQYLVYSENDDEFSVESMVIALDNFTALEDACIANWSEEDDDPDEMYVDCVASDITDEYLEYKDSSWFKSLEVLIDERA